MSFTVYGQPDADHDTDRERDAKRCQLFPEDEMSGDGNGNRRGVEKRDSGRDTQPRDRILEGHLEQCASKYHYQQESASVDPEEITREESVNGEPEYCQQESPEAHRRNCRTLGVKGSAQRSSSSPDCACAKPAGIPDDPGSL